MKEVFEVDATLFGQFVAVDVLVANVWTAVLRFLAGRTGASTIGSAMRYVLVAPIGMHMDLKALFDQPFLFLLGLIWIAAYGGLMLLVAKPIRAPLFFMAVGSQANIGGAASAPIIASAFHPALAPVGVLLAVLGYALGTCDAYITGLILRSMAG